MHEMFRTCRFEKGHWKPFRSAQARIIRIFPRISGELLLHVPFRSVSGLTDSGDLSWEDLYIRHQDVIRNAPDSLGEEYSPNEENNVEEEEEDASDQEDDDPEEREEWMVASALGPRRSTAPADDLGNREMDRNHDWGAAVHNYPQDVNFSAFLTMKIQESSSSTTINTSNPPDLAGTLIAHQRLPGSSYAALLEQERLI
ncbi:hypothetical protein PsorP6_015915 [Peronosclerospora sorghi]|uniref:Uncharacterized protein n=1 Tax=Peronosclerospora sorghi TaxID=230839 RepID=A0ACC0WQ62_9STRA|nr:hypothetical protein PsorP6_015915 [Peronosclerospora sorghi]